VNAHIDFLTCDAHSPDDIFPAEPHTRHWLHSPSFRLGLCEGFGAPVFVLRRREYPRASSIDTTFYGAWKVVGDALRAATISEGARVGKTTRKGKQGRETVSAD
jgi:hypothetical protein